MYTREVPLYFDDMNSEKDVEDPCIQFSAQCDCDRSPDHQFVGIPENIDDSIKMVVKSHIL